MLIFNLCWKIQPSLAPQSICSPVKGNDNDTFCSSFFFIYIYNDACLHCGTM